jgi:uncharacterized membrane protein YoaK (UPF0700 family)
MLASRNYTLMAFVLSWISGFTDAVAYPVLFQVFIANMSGNGVAFGIHAGKGQWEEAIRKLYPFFYFRSVL